MLTDPTFAISPIVAGALCGSAKSALVDKPDLPSLSPTRLPRPKLTSGSRLHDRQPWSALRPTSPFSCDQSILESRRCIRGCLRPSWVGSYPSAVCAGAIEPGVRFWVWVAVSRMAGLRDRNMQADIRLILFPVAAIHGPKPRTPRSQWRELNEPAPSAQEERG